MPLNIKLGGLSPGAGSTNYYATLDPVESVGAP